MAANKIDAAWFSVRILCSNPNVAMAANKVKGKAVETGTMSISIKLSGEKSSTREASARTKNIITEITTAMTSTWILKKLFAA